MSTTTEHVALTLLLLDLFSPEGLRIFLSELPGAEDVERDLPGRAAEPRWLSEQVVKALWKRGLLGRGPFFEKLKEARPYRSEDIELAKRLWQPLEPEEEADKAETHKKVKEHLAKAEELLRDPSPGKRVEGWREATKSAQLLRLHGDAALERRLTDALSGVSGVRVVRAALVPKLRRAVAAWRSRVQVGDGWQGEELADVVYALVRRWILLEILGVFGAMMLIGQFGVLVWQTVIVQQQREEFRTQNASIEQQISHIQEQVKTERSESQAARRAQLTEVLYTCETWENTEKRLWCETPMYPARARREAVLAFLELEWRRVEEESPGVRAYLYQGSG